MKVKEQFVGETERLRQEADELRQEKTERKETSRRLEESEALGASILNAVPHAVIGLRNRRIIFANNAVEAVFGWRPAELIGKTTRVLYRSDEESQEIADNFYPMLDKQQTYTEEFPCRHKDGRDIMCLVSTSRIGTHLKDRRIVAVYTDITERKRSEEAVRETEQKHRRLFDSSQDGIAITTLDGELVDANQAYQDMVGYTLKELKGINFQKLTPKKWHKPEAEAMKDFTSKGCGTFEKEYIRKDGTIFPVSLTTWLIRNRQENPAGIGAFVKDITERKRADAQLRESEQRVRDIAETTLEWIWEIDTNGKYTYASSVSEKVLGYKPGEILKKHFYDLFHPDDREELKKAAFETFAQKQPFREFINRNIHKNGKTVWLSTSGVPILDEKGKLLGYRGADIDITERKQIEEALKESEEKHRARFESAMDAIVLADAETGIVIDCNPATCKLVGRKKSEIVGQHQQILHPPQEMEGELTTTFKQHLNEKESKTLETQVITKKGESKDVAIKANIIELRGKKLLQGIFRDITKRKKAEQTLRESEEKYRQLTEEINDAIYTLDQDGNVTYISPVVEWLSGYSPSEIMGRSFAEFFHEEDLPRVMKDFEHTLSGHSVQAEYQFCIKSGEIRWVGTSSRPIFDGDSVVGARGVLTDITNRKLAEEASEEARMRFEDLFESANELIITTDVEGWILHVNKEVERFSGYSKKELIGQSILTIAYPEDTPKYIQFWKDILNGLTPRYELRGFSKTGDISHLLASASVIRKDGNIVEIQYNAKDITEEKQAEEKLRASGELFRSVVEYSHEGILIVDDAYRFTYVNDELCRISGYSREETIGRDFRKFLDADSRQLVADRYARRQRGEELPPRYEFNIVCKNGDKRRVEISSTIIKDSAGKAMTVAQLLDITERKKGEEALRQSEERYRTILENIEDGYYAVDLVGNFTFFNDSMCRILGYTKDEMMGMNNRQYMSKENARKIYQIFNKVYTTGKPVNAFDWEITRKDGTRRISEASVSLIKDAAGQRIGFRGVVRDITERKQAEKALQEAKTRFEDLFETANELIITTDPEGWILHVNKEVERFSGYSKKELIGQSILNIAYPEDTPKYIQFWKDMLSGLNPRYHLRGLSKAGNISHLLASGSTVTKDGKTVEIQYNAKNITEEKQAEEKLRESEKKYRTILESVTEGYYELDLAGNLTFFNDSTCKMLGYSKKEMLGMNNREYEDKENARKVYQAFNEVYTTGKPIKELEFEVIRKDGTKGFIETSASLIRDAQGKPVGFRGIARDITERKQMEAERDAMEKKAQLATRLSVVGEMASGIVHEINNPLTSVIGFAEMLAQKELPEDAREYATIINNEGKRVSTIANRLLNFARHQKPETVYTDINKLVEATLELQAYEMTTGNIKVTAKLDPHLPQTMADPGQLQQVFLNIILNARTEMRVAHGGGRFLIKTQAIDNTIQISFKDDGPGIPKKNLQRIFDPFFTTRKAGKGTGLGLSICQGIIFSHDGTIYARSTLGKGATFIIELPVVARQRKIASNGRANHVNNKPWR